uniref:Uncharacterized protein n=1 Tax=Anguilla anguilla TaxID=7936 RepID=A0A0E9S8R0_ANGAN
MKEKAGGCCLQNNRLYFIERFLYPKLQTGTSLFFVCLVWGSGQGSLFTHWLLQWKSGSTRILKASSGQTLCWM